MMVTEMTDARPNGYWKSPPKAKIYEALSAIGDGRG